MLHHKIHRIPAFPAAKALVNIADWIHVERRSFLVVKRTAGNIIDTAFFQREEITYYFFDTGRILNARYGWFADHASSPALLPEEKGERGVKITK